MFSIGIILFVFGYIFAKYNEPEWRGNIPISFYLSLSVTALGLLLCILSLSILAWRYLP